ncbi:hypothetical protein [Endozoicomonas lisbonensis]|uniref:BAX inhibitor (BI)-1/YccA family protein n=1 Tax=Endozoicomonas lisbonensis TaxID=3120522 RepID=A0ABV2SL52_9GAMM
MDDMLEKSEQKLRNATAFNNYLVASAYVMGAAVFIAMSVQLTRGLLGV